ncbi:bile acid:sodium symporter family protein [Chloroflexota bacterium]
MSIRASFIRLFRHTGFILALAIVVGLAFGQAASWTEPAVTPVLGLVMTLSIIGISPGIFLDLKKLLLPILLSLVLNYVVLTGTFIGLASVLIQDYEIWTGFVIVAAVPPAVAVIPFTYRLGGNTNFSLVGAVATYLAALVITPLICILFLGVNFFSPWSLLVILAELIIAPLIVSGILRRTGIASKLERYRGSIVNWGFFLVIYTVIGLNRDAFLEDPVTLLRVSGVAFAGTFVLIYLINRISRFLGVKRPDRISLVLLGATKNYGLAAAIALTFFDSRVAMPSAVASTFFIASLIWLTLWVKRWGEE